MKQLFTLLITAISISAFAQKEVKVTEESISYSIGSKNSIVVTIPYGQEDIVEKELKNEMKDWGGKYSSSKGEAQTLQSSVKKMFESKTFDSYAKITKSEDGIKVAVAIDLGGAFLSSKEHSSQFSEMKERLQKFAVKAAKASIQENLKVEGKILAGLEKEEKGLEKEKESHLKNIEDYKKKITDSQKKIEENVALQTKKKAEVKAQATKIKDLENLKVK